LTPALVGITLQKCSSKCEDSIKINNVNIQISLEVSLPIICKHFCGKSDMIIKMFVGNLKEETFWKTYGVDGRITLMWNLNQ
jgi:hypothetical protein